MKILIVDDEQGIRSGLRKILSYHGYDVLEAGSINDAVQQIDTTLIDCVLLDLKISDEDGLRVLDHIRSKNLEIVVIVMTGFGDVRNAVQCMKRGADNYLTKPIDNDLLFSILDKEIQVIRNKKETNSLKIQLKDYRDKDDTLVDSENPLMQRMLYTIERVKDSEVPILITGETGTGKEVTARYIHMNSQRYMEPFVSLNCAALNDNLLESELFGHVKGAFTGADKDKPGRFEAAGKGTLFLDELGDMSLLMQVKLLRVLQESLYEKVGGIRTHKSHCRIIAATNKNLKELIEKKQFREDLYYRLNLVELNIPPLRERRTDIKELINLFLSQANHEYGKNIINIEPELESRLMHHDWPGNIRQLKNAISNAVLMSEEDHISMMNIFPNEHSEFDVVELNKDLKTTMAEITERYESEIIRNTLKKCSNNVSKSAGVLGISRKTLYQKMKEYSISVS